MLISKLAGRMAGMMLTVLAGGLITAAMVRSSPGFGVDERELDPRLSRESIEQLRRPAGSESGLGFYREHLAAMLRGELGYSESFSSPVRTLLLARAPVTARLMTIGLAGAWSIGLSLAFIVSLWRVRSVETVTTILASLLLCIPSAVVAMLLFRHGTLTQAAVMLVVLPRFFTFAKGVLQNAADAQHILMARAFGFGAWRIAISHLTPGAAPQLLALLATSVAAAFSAAIPVEVFCDMPGIGQLAWKAALARDLPLLVTISLLVTLVIQLTSTAADVLASVWEHEAA